MTTRVGGIVHVQADCDDCEFSQGSRNAFGLAVQHARKTGHTVAVEEGRAYVYNPKPEKVAQMAAATPAKELTK